jgi:hypothetical protein
MSLEERIGAALADDAVTSHALDELLIEVEAAVAAADEAADKMRERALDPTLSADPVEARATMEDAAFTGDRLRAILPRLQQRFRKVHLQEAYDRWVIDYESVKAKVDAAAEELKALYPEWAAKLTDLLLRIEGINGEVRRVSSAKPFDAEAANGDGRWLREVELEARGMEGFGHALSILKDMQLPSWSPSGTLAWPPHRPLDPAFIAPTPGGDPRLHSSRWHEVHEEQDRAARERAAREEAERQAKSPVATAPHADWWKKWEEDAATRAAQARP